MLCLLLLLDLSVRKPLGRSFLELRSYQDARCEQGSAAPRVTRRVTPDPAQPGMRKRG